MERFEVSYDANEQEVAAAARSIDFAQVRERKVVRQQWINRWFNWPFSLAMLYGATVLWWFDSLPTTAREWVTRRDLVVAGVAVLATCVAWFASGLRDRDALPALMKSLLLKSRAARLLGSVKLAVSEEGIRYQAPGVQFSFNWQNVEGIDTWSSPEHFVVWTRFGTTLPIPKSALPEQVRESFVEACSANMRLALTRSPDQEGAISIHYEATAAELAALRSYLVHRARGRYFVPVWLAFSSLPFFVWTLLLAALLIVPWWKNRPPAWVAPGWLPLMFVSFAAIILGVVPFVVYWLNSASGFRWLANKQLRSGTTTPQFLGHHVAWIGPDGFHDIANGIDSFVAWQDFAKIEVWKRHLFLCTEYSFKGVAGHLIPQSAFPSEPAFVEFAATAETYWQNAVGAQKQVTAVASAVSSESPGTPSTEAMRTRY